MINELYGLAQTLKNEGIEGKNWHRKYKLIPKSQCYRIWLDDTGSVSQIECLRPDHAKELRKYGDNQSSFPAFNLSPLYRITNPDLISTLKKIKEGQEKPEVEMLKSWCLEDNWIKGAPKQVARCLRDRPEELLKQQRLEEETETSALAYLAKLCVNVYGGSAESFRSGLEACLFAKLEHGEDIPEMIELLFHEGSENKDRDKDVGVKISVILDLENWQRFTYPVASKQTTEQFNQWLLNNEQAGMMSQKAEQSDAFGMPFVNPGEPMPNVKLDGFDVTLRSMFEGQPCQYRYGKINDSSYPIAPESRTAVKSALEWIAEPQRRQLTWERIDKNEIVFIYPSKLPKVPLKFVSIFAQGSDMTAKQRESRFERQAEEFTRGYRGLPVDQQPETIQIFSLRKIDKARTKVIFTHNSTPEQLIQNAGEWTAGCKNLPLLDVGDVVIPFPLEVADILNAVWKQDGERADGKTPVQSMKKYQGMAMLLNILPLTVIQNFIHVEVTNASGLIHFLGNQIHRQTKDDPVSDQKKLRIQKKAAMKVCSVLALLLFKNDIRKERYMENLPYLLGQLLHVSDELHVLYCIEKRNGDIPPQLVGSSLFINAGEMPYQALSQLSIRLQPYLAWAKQFRGKAEENSWRAGWLLNLFEQFSNQILPQMDKSIRFGDFEKAQLFIGYMASFPKKEKQVKAVNNEEKGDKNHEE